MKITHFGHACLLVEVDGTRILFDPGTLSADFEGLRDLDAILVTHDHDDHLDFSRLLPLLAQNPDAVLMSDVGSAAQLPGVHVVRPGDHLDIGGVGVEVVGGAHEFVYLDVPDTPNVGYVLDSGAFFHPGDSFFIPDASVDILALPTSGPWLRVSDAADYVNAISPRIAVPMHEAALADTSTHYGMLAAFSPDGTAFTPLEHAIPALL